MNQEHNGAFSKIDDLFAKRLADCEHTIIASVMNLPGSSSDEIQAIVTELCEIVGMIEALKVMRDAVTKFDIPF